MTSKYGMDTPIVLRARESHDRRGATASSIAQWITAERDQLSRKLRISLTDACNLGCFFCHNEGQGPLGSQTGLASPSELAEVVRAASAAGVRNFKLTGGEPLIYRRDGKTVVDVVRSIAGLKDLRQFELSMTTNGILLGRYANELKEAGLDRVTISLHSLSASTFSEALSSRGASSKIAAIKRGIEAARNAGLSPLKINMVLFRPTGLNRGNLDEIENMVEFAGSAGVAELRLYTLLRSDAMTSAEFASRYQYWSSDFTPELARQLSMRHADDVEEQITEFASRWSQALYPKPTLRLDLDGLSVALEAMEDGRFESLGLPAEGPYALRLAADGRLRGFLSDSPGVDVLKYLRRGAGSAELEQVFEQARRELLPGNLTELALDA